jgi:phospholipid-binding lipoprotein MlaA
VKGCQRVATWCLAASLALALGASGARAGDESASPPAPPEPAPAAADVYDDEDDWLFDAGPDPAERDDVELSNRLVFGFNEGFYRYLADPIATGFSWVVPAPGRRALYRFFENLETPSLLLSDVLQLAPLDATKTTSRFVINSTVGLAGLFDPASALGIETHHTDFGETLGVWGIPSGSYVVIPVLGPSTARDTFGAIVDAVLHPTIWFLSPVQQVLIRTSGGLSAYDIERERLDALRATSVDFYAAIRSAYLMDRDAHVAKRVEGRWWRRDDEDAPGTAAAE